MGDAKVDYAQLIAKNCILYGESGSGKSTIILDILARLRDKIPICMVISPTELSNGTYDGIIHPYLVHSKPDLTSEQLKQKINEIMRF